jgi:hypothetical protein
LEKYQITSTVIGFGLAFAIFLLVRRDRLHGRFAIWWLGVALACAVLGAFPQLTDIVAAKLGISYPPILVVIIGIGYILLRIITMDMDRSRNEIKITRLAQKLAILEGELYKRNPSDGASDANQEAD